MCHEHFNKSFNRILDRRLCNNRTEKKIFEDYLIKEFGLTYDRRRDIDWAKIPAKYFYKILEFLEINSFDDFLYETSQIKVDQGGLWSEGKVTTL